MTYRIEEVENGRLYWVHFTAVPGPSENYQGRLTLKTNYREMPEIPIQGKVRAQEKDLWEELIRLSVPHETQPRGIKGHAGQQEDERCDALIKEAIRRCRNRQS